jgi:hypothetical protein
MSTGFSQQLFKHPSQYGYNDNNPCNCPECCSQMNNQSYPGPYNQQMPHNGQQLNPYSGNQYSGNNRNPQYQSNYTNQNGNFIPHQTPKNNSSNLKTGFNLINQYNNGHHKKQEN